MVRNREQADQQGGRGGGRTRIPAGPAPEAAAAEGAEVALLRTFLMEKDLDVYGHFGQTVSCMLRALPAAASGNAMLDILHHINEVREADQN